ncbi:LLM class flavin-dependent oxidoreductase [Actinacidiphila yeochonensis]|uniref:LLM class flavin-dependent oxidoreductase n=1 Tax=Actinacidiphila yeochonensis TaxID=89050 RepID=UPI000AEB246A|nr:LLM class flavin-dependent oxidoreductase [Actinacidiphila yeochonensis]
MTGALRPGMLRLGWREGGGAITNFLGPRDIPAVRGAVDGLGLPDRELVCRIFVCPTPDTAYARAVGRSMLARILTRPTYHAFHAWLGRGDLMKETVRRAEAGDWAGAAAAVPDQIVDDLLVHGDIPTCRAKIQAYVEAGVDTPVLMFSGLPEHRLDASAISELVRALGPAASD